MILFIAILVLLFLIIGELSVFKTFGDLLTEEEIDEFFEKEFEDYSLTYSANMKTSLFYKQDSPYVASLPFSFFEKYYIEGIGTIPRWNHWSKFLTHVTIITKKKL